ncbi:hypothetical protein MMC06_005373 [Schaereria dolodes]|nr:hypothetical protein [Schaereria dolodes]
MTASSKASSPTAVASSQALAPLAPSSVNRPSTPMDVIPQATTVFTKKQWVIPPRPKPGRKPATDTPPTKRKAQNRAAQRAFRERRAAKVGELEEQMKDIEAEDEREQDTLRAQISRLETDVEQYHQTLISWRERSQNLEKEFLRERQLRATLQSELSTLRGHQPISTEAIPLPSRNVPHISTTTFTDIATEGATNDLSTGEIAMGCGNCSIATRCECIEQAFDIRNIASDVMDSPIKRPHSPSARAQNKRIRNEDPIKLETEALEIDFTTKGQAPPLIGSTSSPSSLESVPVVIENCGFCQNDTTCLCAELAAETSIRNIPRIAHLLSQTSDSVQGSDNSLNLYSSSGPPATSEDPCKSGPGTCNQCRSDATSTLFCKSLASTRSGPSHDSKAHNIVNASKISCGNPDGCCRDTNSQVTDPTDRSNTQAITGPTLTCADTYTTLSRHPGFEKASNELGTWLPQLATIPKGIVGRTAFEIEVASVMGVLRFFDRRFGRDGSRTRSVGGELPVD